MRLLMDAMATMNISPLSDSHCIFNKYRIFLQWLLLNMRDKKFHELANNCLLVACFQFSPAVILCSIEHMIFVEDDQKLRSEAVWSSIVPFIVECVHQFGVHNILPIRLLRLMHHFIACAKHSKVRHQCFDCIQEIYLQLGKRWKPMCLGSDKNWTVSKALQIFFKSMNESKEHKQPAYKQLRFWRLEKSESGFEFIISELDENPSALQSAFNMKLLSYKNKLKEKNEIIARLKKGNDTIQYKNQQISQLRQVLKKRDVCLYIIYHCIFHYFHFSLISQLFRR